MKYFLVILLGLSACTPSPEESARNRRNLAKLEDGLAECRLLALKKNFQEHLKECHIFIEKNTQCAAFPEQKEGCVQFIHAPNYASQRLDCKKLSYQEKNCAKLINAKKENWVEEVLDFKSDIHIGIVWTGVEGPSYLQGLRLAVTEINKQGGILGRQLNLEINITNKDLNESRTIAKRMRDNENIRIVIGKQLSSSTIPVTYIYENANIVYFAISASNKKVIRRDMQFIFRQIPNNEQFSKALVNFFIQKNYKKIALLYSRDAYSEEFSYAFYNNAITQNLKIVYEKSFFKNKTDFSQISADLRELELDVILLATFPDIAHLIITDLHNMGVKIPIIGSNSLDSEKFAQMIGEKGNGIIIPTMYNSFSTKPKNTNFQKAFRNRYGYSPDTWAAQAYDTIKLLAHVMEKEVHSTVPTNIAAGLRHMATQTGATGLFAYQNDGELKNKPIYFKELQHEEFFPLQSAQETKQIQKIEIINDRIIFRPEKTGESTKVMSTF